MKQKWRAWLLLLPVMTMLCACGTSGAGGIKPASGSGADTEPAEMQEEPYTGNGSEWCSELFVQPATQYDGRMALVAAEMSEKAENSMDDETSIRKLYSDYGLYACEYQNFRKVDIKGLDFLISESAAFAIGQDTLNINGTDTTILIITARGTKNLWESLGDWGKGGETGFLDTYVWQNAYEFEEKIWAGMDEYVSRYPAIKETDSLKILVTGHSLGGAAANLVGAKLTAGIGGSSWWSKKVSRDDIYVYTYGAIKVLTMERNISDGYENIHNIFNYYDSFGPEGNFSILNASSFYAKFGHTDLYRDDSDKDASAPGSDSLDNHLMENYKRAIRNDIVKCTAYDGQAVENGAEDAPSSDDPQSAGSGGLETFAIEGKWKNTGSSGFGQAQPGAIVIFDGAHCNYYSPKDTYVLYEENGRVMLDCTSFIFAETLSFTVEIIDEDNVVIYYGSDGVQLKRVG